MNAGIEASAGRYVLALNPDCRLEPDFAATLVRRLDARGRRGRGVGVGAAPARAGPGALADAASLDSTGHRVHGDGPALRPRLGRAGRRPLREREEEIAGASGAAGFYRRAALRGARISTGCFDADFFLYREDADLAWRLAALGWRCLYVPGGRGLPPPAQPSGAPPPDDGARQHALRQEPVPAAHQQPTACRAIATCVPTLARDIVVLGACLTVERSSLPAFGWLWRNRRRLWAKRREIREKVRSGRGRAPALRPRIRGRVGAALRPPALACDSFLTDANRHPRHPRHPGPLRRLRDPRRGALGAARRARPRRDGLHALALREPGLAPTSAARRSACCRRSRRSTSTPSSTARSSGVDAAFERFDAVLDLQRDQRGDVVSPAPLGRGRASSSTSTVSSATAGSGAPLGGLAYRVSEWLSTVVPDAIVTDAKVIEDVLPGAIRLRVGRSSRTVATCRSRRAATTLDRLDLTPERYVLYVSRLEPENNALAVLRAYRRRAAATRRSCSSATPPMPRNTSRTLRAEADPRVVFRARSTARGTGELLATRRSTSRPRRSAARTRRWSRPWATAAWSATTRRRKTRRSPGARRCPFDALDPSSLTRLLQGILDDPAAHSVWKERATQRTRERYRWDDVVDRYEAVLEGRDVIQ